MLFQRYQVSRVLPDKEGESQLPAGGQLHQAGIKLKETGFKGRIMGGEVLVRVAECRQPWPTSGHAIQHAFKAQGIGVVFEPAFSPHHRIQFFKFLGRGGQLRDDFALGTGRKRLQRL